MGRITELFTRYVDLVAADAPEVRTWLNPPLSAAEVSFVEQQIGVPLSDDVREWFSLHNGSWAGKYLFGFGEPVPLDADEILETHDALCFRRGSRDDERFVRPQADRVNFVTITYGSGNPFLVELAGVNAGVVWLREAEMTWLYRDIEAMLRSAVELYELGFLRFHEQYHGGVHCTFEPAHDAEVGKGVPWRSLDPLPDGPWPDPSTPWEALGGGGALPLGPRHLALGPDD